MSYETFSKRTNVGKGVQVAQVLGEIGKRPTDNQVLPLVLCKNITTLPFRHSLLLMQVSVSVRKLDFSSLCCKIFYFATSSKG